MICNKCGKQLEDECLFCTECGNEIGLTKKQTQSREITKNNKTIKEIENFIDRFGDTKINKYISIATIIFMISIRLLGFIVVTALITIINSVLIYYNYKKSSKLDMKMMLWSISVLVIGVLVLI